MIQKLEEAALHKTDVDVFKSFWDFINVTDEEVLGYAERRAELRRVAI